VDQGLKLVFLVSLECMRGKNVVKLHELILIAYKHHMQLCVTNLVDMDNIISGP